MNTQEKAAWLADLYQHVADGGELEHFYHEKGWLTVKVLSPTFDSTIPSWRKKPMKQVES